MSLSTPSMMPRTLSSSSTALTSTADQFVLTSPSPVTTTVAAVVVAVVAVAVSAAVVAVVAAAVAASVVDVVVVVVVAAAASVAVAVVAAASRARRSPSRRRRPMVMKPNVEAMGPVARRSSSEQRLGRECEHAVLGMGHKRVEVESDAPHTKWDRFEGST